MGSVYRVSRGGGGTVGEKWCREAGEVGRVLYR